MKILITGGAVHAKLDAVKIITNKFKGGMMVELAQRLAKTGNDVTYLCAKGSKEPRAVSCACGKCLDAGPWCGPVDIVDVVYHDGFHDYRAKVLGMAKDFDCVILGAAVANLIPAPAWDYAHNGKKFPSHEHKVGDIIHIPFTIAPRIIDEVKAHMKPQAHLIGFKLLDGVTYTELATAAYGVLKESGATIVFANDAKNLKQKYVITKEFSELPLDFDTMTPFILRLLEDEYYHSVEKVWNGNYDVQGAFDKAIELIMKYRDEFVEYDGLKFGSVAWRVSGSPSCFVTTARGKKETDELVIVDGVDHKNRKVSVFHSLHTRTTKASLNAPLLANIFEKNPNVHGILHFHRQEPDWATQRWAPPGTIRDTDRDVSKSFNVEGHGCYLFLNEKGDQIGENI